MMKSGKREVMRQAVEIQGEGSERNYKRWESAASALFVPLGILRAVTEGSFTPKERARAIDAVETELRSLNDLFPAEERKRYTDALAALRTASRANEDFLRKALGERIRFAMRQLHETAPSKSVRDQEDVERRAQGEAINPSHLWLDGFEAKEIADRFSAFIAEGPEQEMREIHLFYLIGHLQRLLMIVKHLRDDIDNEEIDVGRSYKLTPSGVDMLGKRDADECVKQITHARDSLIKSLLPVTDRSRSSIPDCDIGLIDRDALDNASDIAGWLSVVKARSV